MKDESVITTRLEMERTFRLMVAIRNCYPQNVYGRLAKRAGKRVRKNLPKLTCKYVAFCPWCHYRRFEKLYDEVHALGQTEVTATKVLLEGTRVVLAEDYQTEANPESLRHPAGLAHPSAQL